MPGWHEATKTLQEQGKLQMVGIIQEQHPDRTRLFMQWKKMGWPILVDSLNLLEVSYVPITLEIDEHGVIRRIHPPMAGARDIQKDFLEKTFDRSENGIATETEPPDLEEMKTATKRGTVEAWRDYADALILWGGLGRLDGAIRAYGEALRIRPADAPTHFRLGVAYRMRYDSGERQGGDFQIAVEHWTEALDIDPNNYIWRRRIQQYGPRLDKPYPFYDWVNAAREEIRVRGELPVQLSVEPGGTEFARPLRQFPSRQASGEEPDPKGRIHRNRRGFIEIETTVVPSSIPPESSTRVHVVLRPNADIKAHWNNEVDDLVLWVDPPEGWRVDRRHLTVPNPPETVSQEVRKVEFELFSPGGSGPATIPAYALYYVCEDVHGTCLYRRQDIHLQVELAGPAN